MDIKTQGYNIPEVTISQAITLGTKTEIGTAAEGNQLAKMVEQSGLLIVSCVADGNPLRGSVLANHYYGGAEEGVDFGGVTNYGGSAYAIAGSMSIESGKSYVTMTMTPLGANRTTSTKSKT